MKVAESLPRAVVLISGGGSNLQSIIDSAARGDIDLDIALVISNVDGVQGLHRARDADISTRVIRNGDFDSREQFDLALIEAIDEYAPDVVILAGFMRILTPGFVQHYDGKLLNIHPSLLPAFPGLRTHQRVIDAGEQWHGCTVHFVTAELDSGPPLLQARVAVTAGETADRLAARVLALEHQIYPIAAGLVASRRVIFDGSSVTLDGEPLTGPMLLGDDAAR